MKHLFEKFPTLIDLCFIVEIRPAFNTERKERERFSTVNTSSNTVEISLKIFRTASVWFSLSCGFTVELLNELQLVTVEMVRAFKTTLKPDQVTLDPPLHKILPKVEFSLVKLNEKWNIQT